MSDDAPVVGDRRRFVKRLGLAAVGATVAAPVVGSATATAAGSNPAYTDAPNVFTADQTINARLGIGTTPNHELHVVRPDNGTALKVVAHTMALELRHDTDWAGQTYDLVNLTHKSAGDAIFIAHVGGKPPGFTGQTGANAGLNVLVPYYIDDTTTGRNGTVVNDHTGMQGLHIETQAVVDDSNAINIQHFSNAYAMYMGVQSPNAGQPVGTGGAIYIDDYSQNSTVYMRVAPPDGGARDSAAIRIDDFSSVSGIRVDKRTAPATSNDAILNLIGRTTASMEAIVVRDTNFNKRFRVDSDGLVAVYDDTRTLRLHISPDGRASFGAGQNFPAQLQVSTQTAGIARTAALINRDGGAGSGASLEFNDASAQFALIQAIYDNRSAGSKAASLSFQVRSSDNMTERLRLGGGGIGFYGASPASRQTVGGSRRGNNALASLLTALAKLGLVTDSSTG